MLYELKTELNYKIRYFQIELDEMNNNANYYPITCECGMPDDTGIYSPLAQTVTDTEIWWDIPIEDYQSTVSPGYPK